MMHVKTYEIEPYILGKTNDNYNICLESNSYQGKF
jgi:hypothetical protein